MKGSGIPFSQHPLPSLANNYHNEIMVVLKKIRKQIFRQFKRRIGEQRARNLAIKITRAVLKFRPAPSISLEKATHVDGRGVYLQGNLIDVRSKVSSIDIVMNNGDLVSGDNAISRVSRAPIFSAAASNAQGDLPGFVAWIDYPQDKGKRESGPVKAHSIRLNLKSGRHTDNKLNLNDARQNPMAEIRGILHGIPARLSGKRALFNATFGPAIKGIWSLRDANRPGADVQRYNEQLQNDKPEVSLIIPIYGRYDFIEHQISVFINDPEMMKHEIIYVIDDPRLSNEIRQSCESLSRIYKLPFTVLYLSRNMGYAGANNVGVEYSRGREILLMNSDVMPAKSGWLRELLNQVGDDVNTTISGVRLVYEDDTVQHEGMEFFASPFFEGLWTNIHPGKGMPSELFADTSTATSCEAVTGACMLLSRSNYLTIGGLEEDYILGDFEDSDLCMKAHEIGLRVQLMTGISLYHLERQSQSLLTSDRWKEELTYFNCWQHHERWDQSIQLMKASGTHG